LSEANGIALAHSTGTCFSDAACDHRDQQVPFSPETNRIPSAPMARCKLIPTGADRGGQRHRDLVGDARSLRKFR